MSGTTDPSHPAALLDELETAFLGVSNGPGSWAAVEAARARARRVEPAVSGPAGTFVMVVVFLAEALCTSVVDGALSGPDVRRLMEAGGRVAGLPSELVATATYFRLVREPGLLQLPPQLSVATQLGLLCAFSGATQVSLWEAEAEDRMRIVASSGAGTPGSRARAEARRTIEGAARPTSGQARLHGVRVTQWEQCRSALVVRVEPVNRERALVFAAEAASALSVILERDALIKRSGAREETLVAVTERRLARLGFDLHDGPLQDLAALAAEVRHFRRQLPRLVEADEPIERMQGRLDDVEARLVALDRDLRELARSFESPAVLKRSFAEAVRNEVQSLSGRTKIQATVQLDGDFRPLSESQKIALFRIVQESLANVREHSGATSVHVAIVARPGGVELEIVDNGNGFEVEAGLLEAARRGRLGLVGMNERVRLLGGTFKLQSRRGGPTKVGVNLPEWRPLGQAEGEEAPPARVEHGQPQ